MTKYYWAVWKDRPDENEFPVLKHTIDGESFYIHGDDWIPEKDLIILAPVEPYKK